jgi:hypothetical protein
VVARGQLFYRHGMETVQAAALSPGDRLETPFHYPAGYAPPDRDPQAPYFDTTVAVRAVEPAGEGEVYAGTVRDAHRLFLTAGVLCAE